MKAICLPRSSAVFQLGWNLYCLSCSQRRLIHPKQGWIYLHIVFETPVRLCQIHCHQVPAEDLDVWSRQQIHDFTWVMLFSWLYLAGRTNQKDAFMHGFIQGLKSVAATVQAYCLKTNPDSAVSSPSITWKKTGHDDIMMSARLSSFYIGDWARIAGGQSMNMLPRSATCICVALHLLQDCCCKRKSRVSLGICCNYANKRQLNAKLHDICVA